MSQKTKVRSLLIIHPDGSVYDNHNFYEMVMFLRQHYRVRILTRAYKNGANKHNHELGRDIVYYFRGWRKLFFLTNSNILRWIFLKLYLFGRSKYDLIIGVDREAIIQAQMLSRMNGNTPYALLSYEIFFEDETSTKFKQAEREACKDIAFAIVQDELRGKHLCEQNHISSEKVMFMPVAAGVAKPYKKTYFLHDHLGIPRDKKILLYAGSIETWSGFPAILYILDSMLPEDWVLVVHSKHTGFSRIPTNFETKRTYFSDIYLPTYHDFSDLLYSAELGLVCYYPDFNGPYCGKNIGYIGLSSGKFNTYIQHGVPVLALYPKSLAEITEKYHLGIGTTDLREVDFATFRREDYAQDCLNFFASHLSFEQCKSELLARVEDSIGGGGNT